MAGATGKHACNDLGGQNRGEPSDHLAQARAIVETLNPKLFPYIWLLKTGFRRNAEGLEKVTMIVSLLGLVAISMAGIGIIGLVAYSVSQRTKEIAIRLALGAKRFHVIAAVLKQFCWPIAIGTHRRRRHGSGNL